MQGGRINIFYQIDKMKKKKSKLKIKTKNEGGKRMEKNIQKGTKGITLIALVITILFRYDENIKCSNNKGFLQQTNF